MNTLTVSELKRRGMAAIEEGLRSGPVHIVKRNKPAAVVLTEADYQRLAHGRVATPSGVTVVQWLLNQRKLESWIFWISVDLVSIPVYAYKQLYLIALLYGVFLGLAILGYRQWRQAVADDRPQDPS